MTNSSLFCIVSSLKCYRCESNESWADCDDDDMNIITCSAGQARCAKVFKQDQTSTLYARGCLTAKQCHDGPKDFEVCRKAEERGLKVTCQMSCCSGDLCNGAVRVSVVSVFMVVICAVVAMLCQTDLTY